MVRAGALLLGGCKSSYGVASGQGRGPYRKPPLSLSSAAVSQALSAGQAGTGSTQRAWVTHRTLVTTACNGETEALRGKWPD